VIAPSQEAQSRNKISTHTQRESHHNQGYFPFASWKEFRCVTCNLTVSLKFRCDEARASRTGSTTSAPFTVTEQAVSPTFFLFGATKYIAATHADNSYLGPASLSTPSVSFTPARPNEVIVLYGNGFGLPSTALTEGSSSQSSRLPDLPVIQIGGIRADVTDCRPRRVDFSGNIN